MLIPTAHNKPNSVTGLGVRELNPDLSHRSLCSIGCNRVSPGRYTNFQEGFLSPAPTAKRCIQGHIPCYTNWIGVLKSSAVSSAVNFGAYPCTISLSSEVDWQIAVSLLLIFEQLEDNKAKTHLRLCPTTTTKTSRLFYQDPSIRDHGDA